MTAPVLYVVAGPNGIGKTTSAYDIIPINTPIINSDEIAKQIRTTELVKTNTQEYSNREAQRLVQEHLDAKNSFAIETNLADEETWKFLKGVKNMGYRIHLYFLTTDDLQLLHQRIKERTLRGEHFVRQDIVEERYYVSLKLLSHYFKVPDIIQLIDNSTPLVLIALKEGEAYKMLTPAPPEWFTKYLSHHFHSTEKPASIKDLSNIEEVKRRYKASKDSSTTSTDL